MYMTMWRDHHLIGHIFIFLSLNLVALMNRTGWVASSSPPWSGSYPVSRVLNNSTGSPNTDVFASKSSPYNWIQLDMLEEKQVSQLCL